tara:strand:+ start:54 stop:344 length:291 start_codon:yes stop_codon:yes gene_type:complete
MWTFKTGDLIAKTHPVTNKPLQMGLVIKDDTTTFLVKWTWYDKVFFMEKEEDIFKDLNNLHLLSMVQIHRQNKAPLLSLVSDSYFDDYQETTQQVL